MKQYKNGKSAEYGRYLRGEITLETYSETKAENGVLVDSHISVGASRNIARTVSLPKSEVDRVLGEKITEDVPT